MLTRELFVSIIIIAFLCNFCIGGKKASKDEKTSEDKEVSKGMKAMMEELLEVEQNLKSKGGSSLIICTIIGPSVLWIKAYIALMLMTYIISELIKR